MLEFITRTRYRKDIIFALTLKVIGLCLLWGLFFSQPVERQITPEKIAEHYHLVST